MDAAVKLDSRFAEAYNDRGVLRHLRGEVTAAISDYDASLGLMPRFAKAWMNRGIARLEQGLRADAERDFAECLRLNQKLKTEVKLLAVPPFTLQTLIENSVKYAAAQRRTSALDRAFPDHPFLRPGQADLRRHCRRPARR